MTTIDCLSLRRVRCTLAKIDSAQSGKDYGYNNPASAGAVPKQKRRRLSNAFHIMRWLSQFVFSKGHSLSLSASSQMRLACSSRDPLSWFV